MINPYINRIPKTFLGKRSFSVVSEFKEKNILVIFSKSIEQSEEYKKLISSLGERILKFISPKEYTLEEVHTISKNHSEVELILSVGGGSIMDFSKLVRLKIDNPSIDLSLVNNQTKLEKKTSLVLIPTTPSTGSQVTPVATIKDGKEKRIILNELNIPDLVILSPKMLSTINEKQMAEFISDIFAHSVESYLSRLTNSFVQSLAIQNIKDLEENWKIYKNSKEDLAILEKISIEGQVGGICQGNAFVGVMHAIAHQIENLNGLSHSKILLNIIRPVLEWYNRASPKGIYEFFIKSFDNLSLEKYKEDVFKRVEIDSLIKMTLLDPSIKTSPVVFNEENLKELLKWISTRK